MNMNIYIYIIDMGNICSIFFGLRFPIYLDISIDISI